VDTYCKVVHAKLDTTKTSITATDTLNDKVLPYMEEHKLPVLRILTDLDTEYCRRTPLDTMMDDKTILDGKAHQLNLT